MRGFANREGDRAKRLRPAISPAGEMSAGQRGQRGAVRGENFDMRSGWRPRCRPPLPSSPRHPPPSRTRRHRLCPRRRRHRPGRAEAISLTFNEGVAARAEAVRPTVFSSPLDHLTGACGRHACIDALELAGRHACAVLAGRPADGHPVGGSLVFSAGAPSAGGPPEPPHAPTDPFRLRSGPARSRSMPACSGVGGAFSWRGSDRRTAALRFSPRLAPHRSRRGVGVGRPAQGLDAPDLPLLVSSAGRSGHGLRHQLRIDGNRRVVGAARCDRLDQHA